MLGNGLLERGVVHIPGEQILILFHAVDEEPFQGLLEHVSEVVDGVRGGCFAQLLIRDRLFANLAEEKIDVPSLIFCSR